MGRTKDAQTVVQNASLFYGASPTWDPLPKKEKKKKRIEEKEENLR